MPRFAVVLSGCGSADGSEIHEAVTALLAIDCAGCAYRSFAPDIEQATVINTLTSEKMEERRNILRPDIPHLPKPRFSRHILQLPGEILVVLHVNHGRIGRCV